MKYYILPVKREDYEKNPLIAGYGYIREHPDELIENTSEAINNELNTYDKSTTYVVYNDDVYSLHKDYVDISNDKRIYVIISKDYGVDN